MPNWCSNRMTISGPLTDMTRFHDALKTIPEYYKTTGWDEGNDNFQLSGIYPIPEQIVREAKERENRYNAHRDAHQKDLQAWWEANPEMAEDIKSRKIEPPEGYPKYTPINTEQEGLPDWYNWSVNNWGTKWDIAEAWKEEFVESSDDTATILWHFSSAWSPPIEWLRHVSGEWLSLDFSIEYFEPGDNFSGSANTQEGCVNDERWDCTKEDYENWEWEWWEEDDDDNDNESEDE
jgi:hypothetical protein